MTKKQIIILIVILTVFLTLFTLYLCDRDKPIHICKGNDTYTPVNYNSRCDNISPSTKTCYWENNQRKDSKLCMTGWMEKRRRWKLHK